MTHEELRTHPDISADDARLLRNVYHTCNTFTVAKPQSTKYFPLYWDIAEAAARQSVAARRQVGCVIVAESGMLSIGWNGMPPGFENECEIEDISFAGVSLTTKPEVIHAERNAINKMLRQGISTNNALCIVTTCPCIECAKTLHGAGIHTVVYDESSPRTTPQALEFMARAGMTVIQRENVYS